MTSPAFFISPEGRVLPVESVSHIALVTMNPETFGLTRSEIEKVYARHGEALGHEGQAREEILVELVKQGWIWIRAYPNSCWSVQFSGATPENKAYIRAWARWVLRQGIAEDPYLPVHLVGFSDGFARRVELRGLANTSMFRVKDGRWRLRTIGA